MNILVKTAGGRIIVRPDTTWEKDNEDVYLPEFVDELSWTPVLFARISKPGRSVGKEFADRYYDGIGYGVLLYPENLIDGAQEGFACASCLDHTSFLPTPVYNKVTLGRENNEFIVSKDGNEIFRYNSGTAEMVEQAIVEATKYCYVRVGDLLAIELKPREALASRLDGKCQIDGTYCDNFLLEFKIIY